MPTSVRDRPLTSDVVRDKFVTAREGMRRGQRARTAALSHGSQEVTRLGYDRAFITSHGPIAFIGRA